MNYASVMDGRSRPHFVPVEGPRLVGRFVLLLSLSVATVVLALVGLWPLAIAAWLSGSAFFFWRSHWQAQRRAAAFRAAGIVPDYTRWEARVGRRLAIAMVGTLGLIGLGLIIATLLMALR